MKVKDDLFTENDFIGKVFADEPPEYDVWNVINGLEVLLTSGYFSNHKEMTWRLQDLQARLRDSLEEN